MWNNYLSKRFVKCNIAFDVNHKDKMDLYAVTYNLDSKELTKEPMNAASKGYNDVMLKTIEAARRSGVIEIETNDKELMIGLGMIQYSKNFEFVEENILKFEAIVSESFDFEVTKVIGTITLVE